MMNFKTLFLALNLMAVFLPMQAVQAETMAQMQTSSQSVTLDMQNMTCALCKITIKKALKGVEGVQKVNVDFDSKTASVVFNPQKTSIDALIKATTNVGYPATVRQAN
jgi:periplasmic mercuric ion binding protein